jgi:hypothetical protein
MQQFQRALEVRAIILGLVATSVATASPLSAQQVGVGLGNATATSSAGNATSNATGGQGSANATGGGVTFNQARSANTRSDRSLDTRLSGGTVSRQTGGLTNTPAVFAPGLAAAGLETCLGSVSGGGSFMGGGFSFGTTVPDPGCAARLDSRTLWSMGLKKAAVARLCLQDAIQRSMPEVCAEYLPQQTSSGYAPAPTVQAARLEPVPYQGGAVEVVEKRTGRTRICASYDPARGRCLAWGR